MTNSTGDTTVPQVEGAEITEPPQLPEDVNDDGVVNIIDLTLIAANFGATGMNAADVNSDGVVNIVDLTLVAAAFGNTAGAPIALGLNTVGGNSDYRLKNGSRFGDCSYKGRCCKMASRCPETESYRSHFSAWDCCFGRTLGIFNTKRDSTFVELSKPVQIQKHGYRINWRIQQT